MKRKEIIYKELERLCNDITIEALSEGFNVGFDAELIGDNLGIARNTVSKELNTLYEEGLAIKVKSRPVLFIHKKSLEKLLKCDIDEEFHEVKDISLLLRQYEQKEKGDEKPKIKDPFMNLIGYDKSLKDAIAKTKAAVLYPPNGLNIMLTGQSGVGKTYFAELIHEFAQNMGITKKQVPFVYFNCSEYYNNPELLTSHLFGHKQGAFTGAASEKEGIIKKADGGFLFLDEVHRLPSEGQEKLFSIIDKGTYRKLGSSEKEEKISIRLICATTEDIKSALLKTFLRRIQVVVELPQLKERTLDERIEMVFKFFQMESAKINETIKISQAFMNHLLTTDFEANIGQLKSDIQFICAQAYLNKISRKEKYLLIDEGYIKEKNTIKNARVKMILENMFSEKKYIDIYPNLQEDISKRLASVSEKSETDIFYSYLSKEYTNLRNSNVPIDETIVLLKNKLETIFYNDMYHNSSVSKNIPREYGYKLEDKIKAIIEYIENFTGFELESNIVNNLRMHFLTLISYVKKGAIPMIYNSNLILDSCKSEYYNAKEICEKIEDVFNIKCPNTELVFMSLLLNELRNRKQKRELQSECGVILIAHGNSTASSMADYANSLFEKNVVQAIDMPLHQSVHDTLDILIKNIEKQGYKKLILLVDIGSLVYFGDIVSKMFGVETLIIKNTNTLALLETVREVIYEPIDFDAMNAKLQDRKIECEICEGKADISSRVLIISCITGMGTSVKIKNLIEDSFKGFIPADMRVAVLDYSETESINKLSKNIEKNERIVGIIGTFKTELPDIPFISLEEIFSEEGIELLMGVLGLGYNKAEREKIIDEVSKKFITAISIESIINYITVLNPQRILSEVNEVFYSISRELDDKFSKQIVLRFMIHCCCMVERVLVNRKPLQIAPDKMKKIDKEILSVIKVSFKDIEDSYDIKLSDGEYYYIYELLFK
jgi:sigma-54 dependent dga operon transcriptional activator